MPGKLFAIFGLVSLLSGSLSSCAYLFGDEGVFPSRSSDYLKARESEPLEVPEGMELRTVDELYAIPDLRFANVLPEKYVVPRVEPLENVQALGSVVVQRFGEDQWVLVKRSPSQSWPLVVRFLKSNDIPLAVEKTEQGLLETDWLAVEASGEGEVIPNERYRFILKSGVQQNTTEVLVKQQSADADGNVGGWEKSTNAAREDNMVVLLAEYLAGSPDRGSHSLLAQGIGSASKVALRYHGDGNPYLEVQLPRDRGWSALQLALTKSGFNVKDRDLSRGIYWVHADFSNSKKAKKRGWLSRLFRIGKKQSKENPLNAYQVQVGSSADVMQVTVRRSGDPSLRPNEQAYLLRKIMNAIT